MDNQRTGTPATLARRMGAMLYDSLLITAIWMLSLFVWIAIGDGEAVSGFGVQLLMLLELVGFFVLSFRRTGQTLGMTAWQLYLVNNAGQTPTVKQILYRLGAAVLSWLPFGAGFWWLLFDPNRAAWHDRLSDTLIVHIPKQA